MSRKKQLHFHVTAYFLGVGVTGFEPATLCSQSRCATGLRYAPSILKNLSKNLFTLKFNAANVYTFLYNTSNLQK